MATLGRRAPRLKGPGNASVVTRAGGGGVIGRNVGFASLSLVFRGSANLLLIVLLARVLTVEQFGLFTFSLATATIFGLVVDYGFASLLLRDLAERSQDVAKRIGSAAAAKVGLSAGALLVLAALGLWPSITSAEQGSILLLFVAQAAGSFGNLLLVPYKCLDRFEVEALWVGVEAIGVVGGCVVAALATGSALGAAAAYAGARSVFFLGTVLSYRRKFRVRFGVADAWNELLLALPFGVHLFVGTAYLNFDTVLLRAFVSLDQIGLYQAGIRLVVLTSMFLGVVNSVLIPRLAADRVQDPMVFRETARRSVYVVTGIGMLVGLPMMLAPGLVLTALYGASFAEAATVVTVLGAVVVVRFFGAVYGILLTVSGRQTMRAVAAFLTLVALGASDLWTIPRFGIQGAAWVLLAAHVALVSTYVAYTRSEHGMIFLRPTPGSPVAQPGSAGRDDAR